MASKATVIYGSEAMDLDSFEAALNTIDVLLSGYINSYNVEEVFTGMNMSIAMYEARKGIRENKGRGLLDLLIDHHRFEATEPIDQVYALLGIACDVELVQITSNAPKFDITVDKKNPINSKMAITVDQWCELASTSKLVLGNVDNLQVPSKLASLSTSVA